MCGTAALSFGGRVLSRSEADALRSDLSSTLSRPRRELGRTARSFSRIAHEELVGSDRM